MTMRRLRALSSLFMVIVVGATSARGDGIVRDAVGPISTGRGGTNIGFSDNGAVLLDNPAGIVNISSSGFYEAAVDTVITDIHYTDQDPNDVRAMTRPFPGPELAYVRKSDDGTWAYGIGAFAPAGFGATYHMFSPIFGPSEYKSIGALGKILPAVAVQLTDDLSVGGTLGLALTHVELEGPFFLQTGPLAGVPTVFDLQNTGAAITGSLGLQYKWSDDTVIGLAYTSESRFQAKGRLHTDIAGLGPGLVPSHFETKLDIVWPRSLGLGVKHNLCDCQRVSADVIWFDWSHAFDRIDIRLTDSSNPLIPALVGPVIHDSIPLNWHDSVSFRFGYEWAPTDVSIWRAGYVYHRSPVPDSTLCPYVDGVLEHAFSIGFSRKMRRAVLNCAYQYSFGPTRHVDQSAIVGGDFSNSTFNAQAHWASIGLLFPF